MSAVPFNMLWLQSGGCGGCTMSLLCAEAPDLFATLASANIRMLWHPTLSEETGAEAVGLFERILAGEIVLDALCVEGALLRGPNGTGRFHILAGTGRPMLDWVRELAAVARHVVAVGTCAAYGGVTAAGVNPTDACGLQYDGRQKGGALGADFSARGGLPVINVAGCPTHPNWVTETLMLLSAGLIKGDDLDVYGRPRFYADYLVHHGCPRNEYYEYKASAEKMSDLGCMMEHLGCLGTQAHADCNTRLWNGEGSCTRGGYACINCTAPEFEEPGHAFLETPKIGGIPVGLPTDMPKAWFIALSSLAKAATPERLRSNATADHVLTPPKVRDIKKR
ncbi:NADH-quinone oxidoreductase subunit B family protein [Xanthobacter variabilis]|uniref:NADH-quinone oxidoreductase subunit B family protein n=1 Tax=Xanthobacter variabilis TaxID=3119932 RepID=UPI0037290E2D